MRIFVVTVGVIFILVFIGLACYFMTTGEDLGERKSTYEWVSEFVRHSDAVRGYTSTELNFISTKQSGTKTAEYWEYVYYFNDSYEIWETVIWFDSQYSRDAVPKKAVYRIRSDGTPRKYLPES